MPGLIHTIGCSTKPEVTHVSQRQEMETFQVSLTIHSFVLLFHFEKHFGQNPKWSWFNSEPFGSKKIRDFWVRYKNVIFRDHFLEFLYQTTLLTGQGVVLCVGSPKLTYRVLCGENRGFEWFYWSLTWEGFDNLKKYSHTHDLAWFSQQPSEIITTWVMMPIL